MAQAEAYDWPLSGPPRDHRFNALSCTTAPQCTSTKTEVTVQTGSSPVHVGTFTITAVYASVSSALKKLCSSVTQSQTYTACKTDGVTIPNIDCLNDGSLDRSSELVIKIAASLYDATFLREAMIKSAAITAEKALKLPALDTARHIRPS